MEILEKHISNLRMSEEFPMMRITDTSLSFNNLAKHHLELEKSSEILFAVENGKAYVSNVTNHEKQGYKVYSDKDRVLRVAKGQAVERTNLSNGTYRISLDATWDAKNKIDWFEIIP